jgi:hypothetical protein
VQGVPIWGPQVLLHRCMQTSKALLLLLLLVVMLVVVVGILGIAHQTQKYHSIF